MIDFEPLEERGSIDFVVPPGAAAAAMAVLCGARSVRAVGRACGWVSPSTAHTHVKAAHTLGLVLWDPDLDGTLRPGLRLVASSLGRNGFLGGRSL